MVCFLSHSFLDCGALVLSALDVLDGEETIP